MTLVKAVLGVILSLITIFGALFAVSSYFATSEEVVEIGIEVIKVDQKAGVRDTLIEERLELNIQDDKIYKQEQYIQRIQDNVRLEARPLTNTEKEILEERQKEVEELKEQRIKKADYYEELKRDK